MTRHERIERQLPELMAELAPARVPDYFDDLLRAAARTPQRPAWRSPERWLSMGTIAQIRPARQVPWQPVLLLVLLVLALAAGLVLVAGSQQRTLPAPLYGPARNGVILFSTPDDDILRVDPATGQTTPVIAGETRDEAPWFTADGTTFFFARIIDPGAGAAELAALFVADADGGNVRELIAPGVLGGWTEWSPEGDRIVIADNANVRTIQVVDAATGSVDMLSLPMSVFQAAWRPRHDALVLTGGQDTTRRFWLVNVDGTNLREIPTAAGTINSPTLSPDGRLLAYSTWGDSLALEGVIHVLDLETGEDRVVEVGTPPMTRLGPRFSPDGGHLLVERYDEQGYRMAILPIDGGEEVVLGDPHPEMTNGAVAAWSPDGMQLLVTYRDDGTTWLYAADGSRAEQVPWPTTEMTSWQRAAP